MAATTSTAIQPPSADSGASSLPPTINTSAAPSERPGQAVRSTSRPFFGKFSRNNSRNVSPTRKTESPEPSQSSTTGGGALASADGINGESNATTPEPKGGGGASAKVKNAKVAALGKLKSFGGIRGKKEKMEFPPSSWGLNENGAQTSPSPDTTSSNDARSNATSPLPTPKSAPGTPAELQAELGVAASGTTPRAMTPSADGGASEHNEESTTLARRIQVLLASMPLFSSHPGTPDPSKFSEQNGPHAGTTTNLSSTSTTGAPSNGANAEIPSAPPLPTTSAIINDSRLMSLLSSASIMNGSISKGKESVFAALDRLGIYSGPSRTASCSSGLPTKSASLQPGGSQETDLRDDSSDLMLYGPLIPEPGSKVEIARSEIISLYDEDDDGKELPANGSAESGKGKGKGKAAEPDVGDGSAKGSDGEKGKEKEKAVWVPSRTQISLQFTWWGYRIFLPPPVLAVLNSKQLEAAKRSAIITTALKWILDHIPVKLLPPQFRPAMMVARRLVPLLGYIGSFIAWSWAAVRTFDKGNGVVLSATWLMPVAVIPGTWEEEDFPQHVTETGPSSK